MPALVPQPCWSDVVTMARHLVTLPRAERPARVWEIIEKAMEGTRWRREREAAGELHVVHPDYGPGHIDVAARRYELVPEPGIADPDYRDALVVALQAIDRLQALEDEHERRAA